MRTNRLYRVRATQVGKAHAARTDSSGTLARRTICGTRLNGSRYTDVVEIRGAFDRDNDCGRCGRVLSTRSNGT
jgi:hypothetical protein